MGIVLMALGSVGELERYGRFGHFGDDVGRRALGVLAGLSQPIPDTSEGELVVWGTDDFRIFENLMEFEAGIRFIEVDESVDGGELSDLHRAFARFHTALPLSEAERHWLFDPLEVKRYEKGEPDIDEPETLIGVTAEVVSGGIRQVIQGREIVRRMAAWRHETDEFASHGTLGEARQALGKVATTLVTDANWPREHEGLRVELKSEEALAT